MKRITALPTLMVAVVTLAGCIINSKSDAGMDLTLKAGEGGAEVRLVLERGDLWVHKESLGPVGVYVYPQFALWAETGDGTFMETLYVTGADDFSKHAAKSKQGAAFFAECLPLWASKVRSAGLPLPSKEAPYPDSVTSATPQGDFSLSTKLASPDVPVILYLEINKSGDHNGTYTEKDNGWAGQPSLIYSAALSPEDAEREIPLVLIGHGGRLGEAPGLRADLSGIDSAKDIVKSIRARLP